MEDLEVVEEGRRSRICCSYFNGCSEKVVEEGRVTAFDEDKFYADCQNAGEAVVQRSGLPDKSKYPVL